MVYPEEQSPGITEFHWNDEEGNSFHAYKIDVGSGPPLYTGEAGMEAFNDAVKREIMKHKPNGDDKINKRN